MSNSKKQGPWKETFEELAGLGEEINDAVKLATKQSAEILVDTIHKHFDNQDLGWEALNLAYQARKKSRGQSTKTLIQTGALQSSINYEISADGLEAKVGVNRTAGAQDEVLIGQVMEYGSTVRGIPPRPFLKPSFEEKTEEMKDRYRKHINKVLQKIASRVGAKATDG